MPQTIFNPKTGRMQPVAPMTDVMALLNTFAANQDASREPAPTPPTPPAAPAMFRPEAPIDPSAAAMNGPVDRAGGPRPTNSGGISFSGSPDWASERASFLSRGSDPQVGAMADALQGRQRIDENIATNRPDLMGGQRNAFALQGLRQAALQDDPDYRREQGDDDAVQQAQTYMNPQVAAARRARGSEALDQQRQAGELKLNEQLDPRQQYLDLINFIRKQQLTTTEAAGHNPMMAMQMGGGSAPAAPQSNTGGLRPGRTGTTPDGQRVVWNGTGWQPAR